MIARAGAAALAALLVGVPPASAQIGTNFNRPGSGARAAGMANAFIAVSDDGTAASWNPAGLAQLRSPELSIVGTGLGQSIRSEGFRSRDDLSAYTPVSSSYSTSYLDFASLAVPFTAFKKHVTFQASWRRLYTLDYRENVTIDREPLTPESPPAVRIRSNGDISGGVDVLSIAGALKLTQRVSLGVSYNHWTGDWFLEQNRSETLLDGTAPGDFLWEREENSVDGDNFSFGLLFTYPKLSVGIVHQRPLSSDYALSGQRETSAAPPLPKATADGELRFAQSLGVGAAWRGSPRWTLAFDLTWDDWKSAVLDTPETGPINIFDGLPEDKTGTRNTIAVNGGAERLFFGDGFVVPLRFGAAYEPQGARNAYTRDAASYVVVAAGTGYNTNSLKFDAAFQYRFASFEDGASFEVNDSSDPQLLPTAVGERRLREWRVKFSLILRITDTAKLKKTLRGIFG
jgi:hypothetical protein